MCFAVKYVSPTGQLQEIYTGKDALIPVVKKTDEIELVRWGREKAELGQGYVHHCARVESIKAGKWDWLSPKGVRLAVREFADWGTDKQVHWHVVPDGQFLKGALIRDGEILRAYVVTEPVPEGFERWSKGGRWPQLLSR